MLVAELPRERVRHSEVLIEQAAARIVTSVNQWKWQLGISTQSVGHPDHSLPGRVYKVALVCCKQFYKPSFTLDDWPLTLLRYPEPPRIPKKIVRLPNHTLSNETLPDQPPKEWHDYQAELEQLSIDVRIVGDEENLVRKHLAEEYSHQEASITTLDYTLHCPIDVSIPASTLSPAISFKTCLLPLYLIIGNAPLPINCSFQPPK